MIFTGHAYSKFIDKGDVDSMPEYVYLNVTLRGKTQFLTLEKNSDFNLNFPMFVLEADDTGKPIVQEVKTRPAKVNRDVFFKSHAFYFWLIEFTLHSFKDISHYENKHIDKCLSVIQIPEMM